MKKIRQETMNVAEYKYSAFISYRHEKNDLAVAQRIQRSIERYHIPAELRGESKSSRFLKVFRDTDELSLNRDLASGIDTALAQSEYLIVILSPLYKESPWCIHEIEEFLKTHDRSHILCVLAKGLSKDVLPEILTNIPTEDGSGSFIYKEPLCADYRMDRATSDKLELPRILCSMLNCSYDDMVKRHQIYRRMQLLKFTAVVFTVFTTIITLQISNLISLNKSYHETMYSQSQTLAAQSIQHLNNFDRKQALSDAINALPDEEQGDDKPVTAEAVYALAKSTYAYRSSAFAQTGSQSMQYNIINYAVTPELHRIVTMDEKGWILVQSAAGDRISSWQIDGVDSENYGFTIQNERTVLAWRGTSLYSYDCENLKKNWGLKIVDNPDDALLSGIYSADLINSSSCSVLTNKCAAVVDPVNGTILNRLYASDVADALMSDSENDAVTGTSDGEKPGLEFSKQCITSGGDVILSGTLLKPDTSSMLCIAVWNPETDKLRFYTYDLPSYCAGLEVVSEDRLIAVSAEERFYIVNTDSLFVDINRNEFQTLDILCFDLSTGAFLWNYDTEMPQDIVFPAIQCVDATSEDESSLVSVTFEVDNYTFDLDTGMLYSSVTFPDSIVLIDQIGRESSSFYCCDHNRYSIIHSDGAIIRSDGFDPFPAQARTAFRIGDSMIAISGKDMYWFEKVTDRTATGSITYEAERGTMATVDCGVGRIALLQQNRLFVFDLQRNEILLDENLNAQPGPAKYWLLAGSLPDRTGALMIGFSVKDNTIHLQAYDSETNTIHALYESPPMADGNVFENTDSFWLDSTVYCDGILYIIFESKKNSILYYDTQTGQDGKIEVTGLPDTMYLAGVYNDYVNQPFITIPTIAASPDGEYMFSTVYDPSEAAMKGAVIDLKTGNASIVKPLSSVTGKSPFVAFNDDHSMLAFSTDYTIILWRDKSYDPVFIPISGLGIESMTWFNHELYVAFSNSLVHCYSEDGDLLSTIKLDYLEPSYIGGSVGWIPMKNDALGHDMIMYIKNCNMNLISADHKATTPLLSVPYFAGWSSDCNMLVTIDPDSDLIHHDYMAEYSLRFYPYYTYEELIKKGNKQLKEMK